jgi:Protein kinase domain
VYLRRYVVIKKLGWGHFSTVWMVKDRKAAASSAHEQYFALKVQKSAEHYTEAAMDEVELLDCIHKERKKSRQLLEKGSAKDNDGVTADAVVEYSQYVATLHDSFFHTGPNGRHMCMVFSMLGNNLLSVIKAFNYRGIPIPVVKNMIRGICKGLDFLHRKCQIIHTDLKPENVLLHFDGSEDAINKALGDLSLGNEGPTQTIEELEALLAKDDLTPDERKKLKRKLKKRRQRDRKKTPDGEADDDDDDDDDSVDDDADEDNFDPTSSFLSDCSMSQILSSASGILDSRSGDADVLPAMKRRLQHSAFVTANFGHRQEIADAQLMKLLRSSVTVSEPSTSDMALDLKIAEKNGGVAEVAFMLRVFNPEEELADAVSVALGGVAWEYDPKDKGSRKW